MLMTLAKNIDIRTFPVARRCPEVCEYMLQSQHLLNCTLTPSAFKFCWQFDRPVEFLDLRR